MSSKKGFSGLDDLSSDIDDILNENHKDINNTIEEKTESKDDKTNFSNNETVDSEKTSSTTPNTNNASTVTNNDSNNGSSFWIWCVIVVGAFGWIILQSNNTTSSSGKTSYSSASQQNYSSSTQSNNYSKTTSDDYYESKPDAYLSTLNKNQLLYCEAEKIRLDAVQNKIDLYSTYEVDKYNNLSNDYNSRCANKQYYKNDMYYVDRNINKRRYELQQEGLARFSKSSAATSNQNYKTVYSLTINTTPYDAKVRILNIQPKYQHGIKLEKGSYHIEVSKDGYETIKQWISLDKDMTYAVELNKVLKNTAASNSSNSTQNYQKSESSQRPNLSHLSSEEKISIEVACSSASYQGPSKYNQCLQNQLNELSKGIRRPNLSHLSSEEKISIEVACSSASYQGPSKYNQCLQNQLNELS
ncbi:PEGA domain-containing protein, partial [Aliarcobacter cryaerophilus]|uniref:PEGA domain-containing protein n=1 Tax=Aliarcobacter cryaerophilus TaxID=28198 RepID=UPI0021B32AD8